MLIYSIGDMPNDFDKRLKDIEDAIEELEMKLKLLSRYSLKSYF